MTYFWKTFGYKKINKKYILVTILCLVLLFFHTRGLYYADDGYILSAAKRVIEGQIPYKDFHFVYTPLTIYIDALALKLFGFSILATRIMAFFFSFATVLILYKIVKSLTSKKYLHYGAVLLFLAWGPTHSNFVFPTQVAISTGLLTCLLLLRGMQTKNYWYIFLAGVTTLLTFLSKQNFGVALLPVAVLFFLFMPVNKIKQSIWYLRGLLLSIVFVVLLFLVSDSLSGFINDISSFSIGYILKEGAFNTQFFYDASFYGILKSLLYLSPLLLSIGAIFFCFPKNKKILFLPSFVMLFYLFGIRPTTDYIHLTPLLSISGLPAIMVLKELKKTKLKIILQIIMLSFIIVGFYTSLWKNYYRWHSPLIDNNYFQSHPRIQIFSSNNAPTELTQIIESQTKPNDSIFIAFYVPMFYFTTNRENATKFDLFEEVPFYLQYKKEILKDLDSKKTKLVITHGEPSVYFFSDYLKKYYIKTYQAEGFYVWRRL